MDEKELTRLLRSQDHVTKRGRHCPDDNQLAAYVNKQISHDRRHSFETHFADCKACLEALTFLAANINERSIESVPAHLIVRARALAAVKPQVVWRRRWAVATATACLLIVFAFVIWKSHTQQTPTDLVAQRTVPTRPIVTPAPTAEVRPTETTAFVNQKPKSTERVAPVLRGANDELKPTLIFPREGSVVQLGQQPIRWMPVAEASFYEVQVVTEEGTPVFTERTNGTELQIRELTVGSKYFVRVVAHLSGARTVKSNLVSFRTAGP